MQPSHRPKTDADDFIHGKFLSRRVVAVVVVVVVFCGGWWFLVLLLHVHNLCTYWALEVLDNAVLM